MFKGNATDRLSGDDLAQLLERTTRLSISPTAFLMMLCYVGLACSHPILLRAPASFIMTAIAGTTALVCGVVWRLSRHENYRIFRSHDLLGILASVALLNISVHMGLEHDRLQTTYFAICILSLGFLMLDRTWFAFMLGAYLVVWVIVYRTLPPAENSFHFEYLIAVSSSVAVAVHIVRVRTTTEAERLRLTAERQREQTEAKLRHAARLITMGELVASIAHELNQPLSAISNYATTGRLHLSKPNFDTKAVRNQLENIGSTALRAGEIIKRIRGLASNSNPIRRGVDLNRVIHDAVAVMSTNLRHQEVTVHMELSENLPRVAGDEIQLQQVVINLIQNGVEALRGSKTPNATVTLRTSTSANGPQVTVTDNGPGIRLEEPHAVFDAFYTTKPDGMGMGLAICRSIIENHGGKCWCGQSQHKQPTTEFSFSIPSANGVNA